MEWDAPAIILDVRPYGEGDAVATVMTEAHGVHRGLARGGASRGKAGTWQPGNMVQIQWTARLSDQLGSYTGELIHAGAAHAMQEALPLAMLTAICAVADGALPEREPLPRVFQGLLHLIPRLPLGPPTLTDVIQWEITVLSDLGYGLDLSACAVTGQTDHLAYVSPKTGRAVTEAGAGVWAARLLPLPAFLTTHATAPNATAPNATAPNATAPNATAPNATAPKATAPKATAPNATANEAAWRDGLRLTGHFLTRDAFGHQHRPLPQARRMLYDRVAVMAATTQKDAQPDNAG